MKFQNVTQFHEILKFHSVNFQLISFLEMEFQNLIYFNFVKFHLCCESTIACGALIHYCLWKIRGCKPKAMVSVEVRAGWFGASHTWGTLGISWG